MRLPASPVSHQNVELKKGRHRSAEHGACVVELASMLAGDRFSDRPPSVCPVIASFMRTVNDAVSEEDLQALYPYAPLIVGTAGSRRERQARARKCSEWANEMGRSPGLLRRIASRMRSPADAGSVAARAALRRGGPRLALSLVELLVGETDERDARRAAREPIAV